ncbi:MAG: Ig-like domain-containing protein, partial [Clostridium sp.]|nr:Ig-like domain-containing protein [Clostridium sp.]
MSKTSATLTSGKTLTLKATVTPTNASNKAVTW